MMYLIKFICELIRGFGYLRIAMQIYDAFGIKIDKGGLEQKLEQFKIYYNQKRGDSSLNSKTLAKKTNKSAPKLIAIEKYRWKFHANKLFQLPIAA